MKWLRNIKKKKTWENVDISSAQSNGQEGVELKLEALTGGTLQSAFNHFTKLTVKHLC